MNNWATSTHEKREVWHDYIGLFCRQCQFLLENQTSINFNNKSVGKIVPYVKSYIFETCNILVTAIFLGKSLSVLISSNLVSVYHICMKFVDFVIVMTNWNYKTR